MWLTIRSDSDMSSPYLRDYKNQNKELTSSSNTDKDKDSDLDPWLRDYPSNSMLGYLNINSIRNKIVPLTDIYKTFPIEVLCIDQTK